MPDFFQTISDNGLVDKKLDAKQEAFFVKNISYYHFFDQLLQHDLDWKRVKQIHGLSQKSINRYLLQLDKLGLIELHPGNIAKSEFYGNCRMTYGMELVKMVVDKKHQALVNFAHIPNEKFRGRKHLSNGLLKMKQGTATEFKDAFRELIAEYVNRSRRESVVEPESSLEEIGFLIVMTPTTGMKPEPIPNL